MNAVGLNSQHSLRNFWCINRRRNRPRGIMGVHSTTTRSGKLMTGPARFEPKTTER